MALVGFPRTTITDFRWRTAEPGREVYKSSYGPEEYVVGSGWRQLAGTITLHAADAAEADALAAFHALMTADAEAETLMPFDREWNGGTWPVAYDADGVPAFTAFTAGRAVADATLGTVQASSVALAWAPPAGAEKMDALPVGSHLSLGEQPVTVVALGARDLAAGAATVTVFPRLEAGAYDPQEAVVRARIEASVLLERAGTGRVGEGGMLNPVTYAWRQVPSGD